MTQRCQEFLSQKHRAALLTAWTITLSGCGKDAQITLREADGTRTEATIPQGMSDAELIQLRGMADNALTLRAERQAHIFELDMARATASAQAQARQDYMLLAAFAVLCLSSAACIIACVAVRALIGRAKP